MEKGSNKILITQFKQDINSIKRKVAVMFIQVTRHVQQKNVDKLKQLFVQIADLCTSVKEPDSQIMEWIEISCSCLGIMHQNSQVNKYRSTHNLQRKGLFTREGLLRLSYNKFTGEFQILQYEQSDVSQDVLQYVSKLNAILFGCQYVDSSNSLYTMLSLYWMPFTFSLIFLVLSFLFLAIEVKFQVLTQIEIPQLFQIIIGVILIFPLLAIYFKALEQKDSNFFQKKLGEQIQKINQDCQRRKINLKFMNPQGKQINIKLLQTESDKIIKDESLRDDNFEQVQETPEDEFMDKIKGLTNEISKISGASLSSFKY